MMFGFLTGDRVTLLIFAELHEKREAHSAPVRSDRGKHAFRFPSTRY